MKIISRLLEADISLVILIRENAQNSSSLHFSNDIRRKSLFFLANARKSRSQREFVERERADEKAEKSKGAIELAKLHFARVHAMKRIYHGAARSVSPKVTDDSNSDSTTSATELSFDIASNKSNNKKNNK